MTFYRMKGVDIFEGIKVTGVTTSIDPSRINKRVTGVKLSTGTTNIAYILRNCAQMYDLLQKVKQLRQSML